MRSPLNQDVPTAQPGEFAPLRLGALSVDPPVVLAPMAGVTNPPFRRLCRTYGAGLYVSEMISARGLCHGNRATRKLTEFAPDEVPRSTQLYGTDPESVEEATRWLVQERGIDHLDMNFGCPVRKVTSNGGGAAVPLKPRLLARIVRAAVGAAGDVPVTIKVRKGVDDDLLTYLDSGRVAQEEGAQAIGLHARTAAQLYAEHADWEAIGELKAAVKIPVLGNGDIWEAFDALRMMRQTGCDGVIVGRGCLGRPWLFGELADVFAGREPREPPRLGEIRELMIDHARLLIEFLGEQPGILHMRKWCAWYTKGFARTSALRARLYRIRSMEELERELTVLDADARFPEVALRVRRGKPSRRQRVVLPEGYLDDLADDRPPAVPVDAAELAAYDRAAEGG